MQIAWLQNVFQPQNRGLRFDVLFVLVSMVAFFLIPEGTSLLQQKEGAFYLMSFVLLQAIGAVLKRNPLHARFTNADPSAYSLLLFLLWVLYIILLSLSMHILGVTDYKTAMLVSLSAGSLAAFFVVRASIRPKRLSAFFPGQETLADLLLLFSAVILFQLFLAPLRDMFHQPEAYTKGLRKKAGSVVLYFVVLFLPFIMFYTFPRFLLFYEDGARQGTWTRFLAIYTAFWIEILLF